MTNLALSRLTGRPVAANSALAIQAAEMPAPVQAAEMPNVPAGMRQIIKPQAQARWILPQLASITPTYIEGIMRGAFAGSHLQAWELFDLMEDTWPRLSKNLNELKNAVTGLEWTVKPWAEDGKPPTPEAEERARLVSCAVWKMRPRPDMDESGFEGLVYDLSDAYGKGTSVVEVLWEIRKDREFGDITAPRSSLWVHPVNYAWSNEGQLALRSEVLNRSGDPSLSLRTTSYAPGRNDLVPFPEDQFLISIQKSRTGPGLTAGRLRALAWWWCAANFSADWMMNLAQVFGLPIRWANYPNGAAQPTINAIASMLEDMGSAGWAAFPEGTNLTLHTPGSLGTMSPQADLSDRADINCDILILGQTLTTEVGATGGAYSLGKVHAGVRGENIMSMAAAAARVLNQQLVPAILRQNYGDAEECPEFCAEEKKVEDHKANADRDAVLLGCGVAMPKKWFYERHGIPLPQPGEEVVEKAMPPALPGQPGAPGAGQGEPEDDAEGEDEDPTAEASQEGDDDATEARMAKAGATAGQAARMLAAVADDMQPIRVRLERILSIQDPNILMSKLEEFKAELPQLLKDINADPKSAQVMESMMHTAFLKGLKQ